MTHNPAQLKYTKEDREWVWREAGRSFTINITDHAQSSLGDVTFVELLAIGSSFAGGYSFGVVESVKAASDLYLPLGGEVIACNGALANAPETVNRDPYGDASMVRIQASDPADWNRLLDAAAYAEIVG